MKKKLLSALLSLAMLLTLLPVSALAVDLTDGQRDALLEQGYTEEQIAELEADDKIMVIDKDTVLDADFDGLILIVGKCTVTIRNAKIGVGVVILPGAVNAQVILEEKADVNAVVVLEEKAEVIIGAEAQASYVTVAAPEAVVTVEGSVEKLTVNEDAEGAEVTVSGAVDALTVDAPNTTTTVEAGASVGAVTVGESAEGTEITVDEAAEVGEINDEAGNATVNGEPVKAEDPEAKDEQEDDSAEEAPIVPVVPEVPGEPGTEEPKKTIAEKVGEGIAAAPLDDHTYGQGNSKNGAYGSTTGNGANVANGLAANYNVTSTKTAENTYDVHVVGTGVLAHGNTSSQGACWVGIAIPVEAGYTYTYCRVESNGEKTETTKVNHFALDNIEYDTFYFSGPADANGMINIDRVYEVTMTNDATGEASTITLNIDVDVQGAMVDGHLVWTTEDYNKWKTEQENSAVQLAAAEETEETEDSEELEDSEETEVPAAPEVPVVAETTVVETEVPETTEAQPAVVETEVPETAA